MELWLHPTCDFTVCRGIILNFTFSEPPASHAGTQPLRHEQTCRSTVSGATSIHSTSSHCKSSISFLILHMGLKNEESRFGRKWIGLAQNWVYWRDVIIEHNENFRAPSSQIIYLWPEWYKTLQVRAVSCEVLLIVWLITCRLGSLVRPTF